MPIPPWAWAAGAAALGVGGALLVSSSTSSSSSPTPPPNTPAVPIAITQGHRYQVTLTFGGPTTAAALLANVVPNLQVGLNSVAPNEFSLVHAIAPNNTQIVYVVDAIGGAPGSVSQQSPQTFYADLNAPSMGGIGVTVGDLGPSPSSTPVGAPAPTTGGSALPPAGGSSSPPASPPGGAGPGTTPPAASGPLTASSPVTDPAMVTYAQVALASLMLPAAGQAGSNAYLFQSSGGAVTPNGNPLDPPTVAAIEAFQSVELPSDVTGQIDWLTWAALVLAAQFRGLPLGTDATVTDAPTVTLAQRALIAAIGSGFFTSIDYGAAQATGSATDAAWRAALAAAMTQLNARNGGKSLWPVDGSLDLLALAILIESGFGASASTVLAGGIVPVTPATKVTTPSEVILVQRALGDLVGKTAYAFLGTAAIAVTGSATDAAWMASLALYQQNQTGLKNRTSAGVLDYLTLASVLGSYLTAVSAGLSSPLAQNGPLVTSPNVVGGAQEALAVVANGRLAGTGISYESSQADGNASSSAFVAALKVFAATLNKGTAAQGFSVNASGVLDYYIFAELFVGAYM